MGAARHTYHALRHMNAYRSDMGAVTSAASGQDEKPRFITAVRMAAIGSHASRYNVSRCRLSRIGCTSVENGDAAHDCSPVDHEPLIAIRSPCGAILISAENRCESGLDNPARRHLNFKAAHQRENIQ